MAVQKQDDQHEHTFSNFVRIRDVVQKTCLRRWTIGKSGKRGSGISVLPARHDDDDDDFMFKTNVHEIGIYIYIYTITFENITSFLAIFNIFILGEFNFRPPATAFMIRIHHILCLPSSSSLKKMTGCDFYLSVLTRFIFKGDVI